MREISKVAAILVTASIWAIPAGAIEPPACSVAVGETFPRCHEGVEVETQNCWQRTIVAARPLTTSYRTMKLKVTFTHPPTGTVRSVYAFYDGASGGRDIIRIRSSFKDLGAWTYSFACEAGDCLAGTGLTNSEVANRSLTVTSLQAPSSNPLFVKGHPVVPELWTFTYPPQHVSNGPVAYANGEPFFWLADSAWAAPLRSVPGEWVAYINDRKGRGFSVVQIGIAPEWAGGCIESDIVAERWPAFSTQPARDLCAAAVNGLAGPQGDESFALTTDVITPTVPTSTSLPTPAFWKRYEEMIQYANCQGITILVAGVMSPVNRYPAFADVEPFARNIAARLSGNAVILSPGFDDLVSQGRCGGRLSVTDLLIRDTGNVLAATAPHLLTTNHFGTMAGTSAGNSSLATLDRMCNYSSWATDPWLDFWIGQSGQNGNDLSRITERPRTLMSGLRGVTDPRFSSASRPAVNGESIYDAGNDPGAASPRHSNRFRARQAGWLSWLSGATGYTFGAQGIWEWGICGLNPPPGGTPSFCSGAGYIHTGQFESYNRAMDEASSQDMTRLRSVLLAKQWSSLIVNEQGRIRNQACNPAPCTPQTIVQDIVQDTAMVVARDYNWILVYAPHNAQVDLAVPSNYLTSGTFFTPRGDETINRAATGQPVSGAPGVYRFSNPGGFNGNNYGNEDWVLGLPRSASSALGWAGANTQRLEARPLTVDADGSTALMGQITSASGFALSTEIEVSERSKGLPFAARAARDGGGNFILAWQETGAVDGDEQVWLRLIDSGGNPLGLQIHPSQSSNRCRNLSVSANFAGDFVALWEEWTPTSNRFELRARSFRADGTPTTDSLPFVTSSLGQIDSSPLLACDATGSCVAAWERTAGGAATAALWLASFSLDSPWSVSAYEYLAAGGGSVSIESVIAEGVGDFELAWESLTTENESLGISGTRLNASALPVGLEYSIRGPRGEN